MRPGYEQLFPFCDIIISSKKGGSGAFPDISEEPFEQTKRFLKFGPKVAGVTLGQQGLVIATKEDGPVLVNSFQTEKVVDTCGAGDCFHGAFLYKYYSGSSPIEAAQFAAAATAVRVRQYGNMSALPLKSEV
eukprot:TRINITY_DN1470_c0_g1_i2.p1 TRINITY_DN1470_c0_g1~~TRINITY_DN1470_c0_g1_i2.p1  ORF type:complete len:132 (-),score=28.06 TRINITY_DN1470_c0_g1_i2:174-569(-)